MSGLLVLAGLLLAVLGLVGLVRGRLGRGLRNRTTSALVAAVGLVVALAAGAVSPAVSDTLAAPAGATSHGAPRARSRCPGDDPGPRLRRDDAARGPQPHADAASPDDAGGDDDEPDRRAGAARTVGPAGHRAGRARAPCPSRGGRRGPATTVTCSGRRGRTPTATAATPATTSCAAT